MTNTTSKKRYLSKTLSLIVCGIRPYLSEKNLDDQELNPLDSTDKKLLFFPPSHILYLSPRP